MTIVHFHNAPWHDSEDTDYSSYLFNGFNVRAVENSLGIPWLGIAGLKMSPIKEPSKTMLVAEIRLFTPIRGIYRRHRYNFRLMALVQRRQRHG